MGDEVVFGVEGLGSCDALEGEVVTEYEVGGVVLDVGDEGRAGAVDGERDLGESAHSVVGELLPLVREGVFGFLNEAGVVKNIFEAEGVAAERFGLIDDIAECVVNVGNRLGLGAGELELGDFAFEAGVVGI